MNKQQIIDQIKLTATANGGIPLGKARFFKETGIRESDWSGIFWVRWNDALIEAGFSPNQMQPSFPDSYLLECYSTVIRDLGHVPTMAELKLFSRNDPNFPSDSTFCRLGLKREILLKVAEFCKERDGFETVKAICEINLHSSTISETEESTSSSDANSTPRVGYVYLLRHGNRREYKIGKTFNLIRREGEIRLQLPEALIPIHYIETDDPAGIENYWHNRFAGKRKEGEWFELSTSDVSAFKRWKKIY